MYSFTEVQFWLSLLAIVCSFVLAFYIPGRVLLASAPITKLRVAHALSIVIGAVFWAWQAYVFGMMGMRGLSYGYLLVFLIIFVRKGYFKKPTHKVFALSTYDPIAFILVVVGVIAQTFPYIRMGLKVPDGINILAHNPDDHIWHAGLIRELISRFPAHEPGMSGVLLKDYHYWFNLLTADLIRVFQLPALQTQFLGMYVLAAVLLGVISYSFAHFLYPSKLFARLFIFLLFFSGDIAGWYMLVLHKTFNMNLSSLINNGTKFLDSPAFALSIITAFTGLYLLFYHKGRLSKHIIFLCAFLFSSLLEFKVYTGITIMLGFAAFAGFSLLKKQYDRVVVFILASVLGAAVFFPGTSSSGGLFFLPFDIPRDFVTQSVLGLRDWGLRWRIYQDHANYIRITQYGLYMTGVYFIIQFGAQLIGLFPLAKTRKILGNDRFIFLYSSVWAGIVLSLFFYQKVGGANIWEFLLPVGIILSLLTALTITLLLERRGRTVTVIVISVIALLVLPRWIDSVRLYAAEEYFTGFHGVDNGTYLSYRTIAEFVSLDDVVVIVNHPAHVAYVSVAKALTEKSLFLSGEGVRQQDTPEILKRRAIVKKLQEGKVDEQLSELKKYNVMYLYYYGTPPGHVESSKKLQVMYKTNAATILKIL